MNTIGTLLAAIDFSDDARHAAHRAALLAAALQARLELLHVMSEPSLRALREWSPAPVDAEAKLIADAQSLLDGLAAEIVARTGVSAALHVEVGSVLEAVLSASERADMIVLGAHGWNPLRDMILGTTAERLLCKSRRPVLVSRRAPQGPYARVIVAIDFSAHSAVALETAMQVAPKAGITALHGFEVPFEGGLRRAGVTDEDIGRYRARARQAALREIAALIEAVGGNPDRFFRVVDQGDPSFMIVEQAQALDADLIVVGSHGRSMVEGVLLGSVTRHVLSDAQCDVLVVRERAATDSA